MSQHVRFGYGTWSFCHRGQLCGQKSSTMPLYHGIRATRNRADCSKHRYIALSHCAYRFSLIAIPRGSLYVIDDSVFVVVGLAIFGPTSALIPTQISASGLLETVVSSDAFH